LIQGAYVRIACNGFNIRAPDGSPIARALFLLASMSNHDCNPNVSQVFHSESPTMMTMIARRSIEPGEEVCGSYVEAKRPRSERRTLLRSNWGFECGCARCARGLGPTGDERHLFGVVCSACGSLFAELEGERCGCGRDDAAIRQRTVDAAMAARGKALELFSDGMTDRSGKLRDAESVDQAFALMRHSLDLFRTALCGLHGEVFFTLRLLATAAQRYCQEAEANALREEFECMAEDRASWISGSRPQNRESVAPPSKWDVAP